jgi:hypothetical protein
MLIRSSHSTTSTTSSSPTTNDPIVFYRSRGFLLLLVLRGSHSLTTFPVTPDEHWVCKRHCVSSGTLICHETPSAHLLGETCKLNIVEVSWKHFAFERFLVVDRKSPPVLVGPRHYVRNIILLGAVKHLHDLMGLNEMGGTEER